MAPSGHSVLFYAVSEKGCTRTAPRTRLATAPVRTILRAILEWKPPSNRTLARTSFHKDVRKMSRGRPKLTIHALHAFTCTRLPRCCGFRRDKKHRRGIFPAPEEYELDTYIVPRYGASPSDRGRTVTNAEQTFGLCTEELRQGPQHGATASVRHCSSLAGTGKDSCKLAIAAATHSSACCRWWASSSGVSCNTASSSRCCARKRAISFLMSCGMGERAETTATAVRLS
jgi:hypothetical protein